jgi:serine/threonine protein kinase
MATSSPPTCWWCARPRRSPTSFQLKLANFGSSSKAKRDPASSALGLTSAPTSSSNASATGGTAGYMAAEAALAEAKDVDKLAADVWSVGVCIVSLFTREAPFARCAADTEGATAVAMSRAMAAN